MRQIDVLVIQRYILFRLCHLWPPPSGRPHKLLSVGRRRHRTFRAQSPQPSAPAILLLWTRGCVSKDSTVVTCLSPCAACLIRPVGGRARSVLSVDSGLSCLVEWVSSRREMLVVLCCGGWYDDYRWFSGGVFVGATKTTCRGSFNGSVRFESSIAHHCLERCSRRLPTFLPTDWVACHGTRRHS